MWTLFDWKFNFASIFFCNSKKSKKLSFDVCYNILKNVVGSKLYIFKNMTSGNKKVVAEIEVAKRIFFQHESYM